jgi:hypothetical protein
MIVAHSLNYDRKVRSYGTLQAEANLYDRKKI